MYVCMYVCMPCASESGADAFLDGEECSIARYLVGVDTG